MTRMEEQRKIDDMYARGELTQEEWSRLFDELSSSRYTAEGKVMEEEK